jgi:hypothetical protein
MTTETRFLCKHCDAEVTFRFNFWRDDTEDPGDGFDGDASCPAREPVDGAMQSHEIYQARDARDAQRASYGKRSYWDYLEQSSIEHHDSYLASGDPDKASEMKTRTLAEALRGNDGI